MNFQAVSLKVKVSTVLLVVFCFIFILVDKSNSPDFAAYSSMYDGSLHTTGQMYFFGNVMAGIRMLSESFEFFQALCVLAGGYALWALFNFRVQVNPSRRRLAPLTVAALLLYAAMFFAEFYVVRLRAGLSISFFIIAAVAFLTLSVNDILSRKAALCVGCFILSLLTHYSTSLVLCLLIMPAMCTHHLQLRPKTAGSILFILATLVIWILAFENIVGSWVERGAYLRSPLHPFRLLMSAVVPLLIFVITVVSARAKVSRAARFPFNFGFSYVLACFVLICFFVSGRLEYDGEAVVRVMTLSSVGSLISIFGWGLNRYTLLPAYLGICNALFFANTIILKLN